MTECMHAMAKCFPSCMALIPFLDFPIEPFSISKPYFWLGPGATVRPSQRNSSESPQRNGDAESGTHGPKGSDRAGWLLADAQSLLRISAFSDLSTAWLSHGLASYSSTQSLGNTSFRQSHFTHLCGEEKATCYQSIVGTASMQSAWNEC